MVDFRGRMAEPGASGDRGADRWALRLSLAAAEGVVVILAAGRVGVVSAPDLLRCCEESFRAGQTRVLLDLQDVDYVSSAGLAVLEQVAALARSARGGFAVCAVAEPVRVSLDLAGLLESFPVEPSRAAGVARLHADISRD